MFIVLEGNNGVIYHIRPNIIGSIILSNLTNNIIRVSVMNNNSGIIMMKTFTSINDAEDFIDLIKNSLS